MIKFPNKEGQLSMELILLTLVVVIGGIIVAMEFTKYHNFEANNVNSIKNAAIGGFTNNYNNRGFDNNSSNDNDTYTAVNYSNLSAVNNSTVFVSGNGYLALLGDSITNYSTISNDSISIYNNYDNGEFSIPKNGMDVLNIHITAWANTKIHDLKSIKNLKLKITGTGNSEMNTVLNNITIYNATIINSGGGTTSNLYVLNSKIYDMDVQLIGGVSTDKANLYITNSTIDNFKYNITGLSSITISNSTINGKYINNYTIAK